MFFGLRAKALSERAVRLGGGRIERTRAMNAINTLEVRNFSWPGGVGLQPPSPEAPYWRTARGERLSLATALAGAGEGTQRIVLEAHARAVAELTRAAGESRLSQTDRHCRPLATAASRLCGELTGLWPDRSWEH
jgi:hypothetical protein